MMELWWWWLCVAIGSWQVCRLIQFILGLVYSRFYCPEFQWSELGRWAVVTGGTDGIGRCYARELAARGFSICIISRNLEKLQRVTSEIGEVHGVQTRTIHADFTGDPNIYATIKQVLQQLDGGIGVLVNNVGMSYKHAEYFHDLQNGNQVIRDLIATNVTACTMMLHLVLPGMLDRRKGVIVNISSLTAIYPMPLLTVYAACKAYVDHLSRATHYECLGKGVFIQSLLPGYVATKMSHRRTSLEVPSPDEFVRSAISTIGRDSYTYGYLSHNVRGRVHEWMKANLPARINLAISTHFMKKARESYMKKLKRKNYALQLQPSAR